MRRIAVLLLTGCFGAPPDVESSSASMSGGSSGSSMGSSEDASSGSSSSSDPATGSAESSLPSTEGSTTTTGPVGTVADTGDLTGQDCAIASCGGVGGYGNCLGMAGECDCGVCDEPLPGGYVCAPECQVDCDCEYPNGDMDFTPRCLGGHCYLECTDAKPCLPEMMCTPSMVDPTTDICVW